MARLHGALMIRNRRSIRLAELVAEQRRNHPELTEAGAFARVYEDPKNRDLAARERAQNRPSSGRDISQDDLMA